jgi:small subunit ribosomal protein S3
MGQKVNPIGLRLGYIKGWDSSWFENKKRYSEKLIEDEKIRIYVYARIPKGGISKIIIERTLKRIILTINTSKPGIIIGKKRNRGG